MSKKDGRCTLIGAEDKKGFHSVRALDHEYEDNVKAAEACPVKIIQVRKLK
jgi:ferredoxin